MIMSNLKKLMNVNLEYSVDLSVELTPRLLKWRLGVRSSLLAILAPILHALAPRLWRMSCACFESHLGVASSGCLGVRAMVMDGRGSSVGGGGMPRHWLAMLGTKLGVQAWV
ncbi:hypothetical protein PIB30_090817 [Stylosanthes scabra]|uniref:Uncharacterized protein n=1 Tax=Stylosanthes scabra TaxID=79078 RepID=A0ABU6WSR3_9FABA|nr:hypothetical protein [Stylosanthes scabra]